MFLAFRQLAILLKQWIGQITFSFFIGARFKCKGTKVIPFDVTISVYLHERAAIASDRRENVHFFRIVLLFALLRLLCIIACILELYTNYTRFHVYIVVKLYSHII